MSAKKFAAISEAEAADYLRSFYLQTTEDELRRVRIAALGLATEVARDRSNCSHTHPGADAILGTARDFFDFIWSGK